VIPTDVSHTHIVADRGDAGTRLDLVVRRHLAKTGATRTRVQRWIELGLVTVNGVFVRRVSSRVALGDALAVAVPESERPPARRAIEAEDVALRVLYEDDQLLVLDKPTGVVVHPAYKNSAGTLLNALAWRARAWPAAERPSIVGRLDKMTSGAVIVARTAAVHAALQRVLRSTESEKEYLAVVHGRVNVARGLINLRLGVDPGDRRRMLTSDRTGAVSLTRFERLSRGPAMSLLRCRLFTGRRHQIRAHLAARGWPIVGDPVYGSVPCDGFPRQALHARRVAFTHPTTGERLQVEAPVPEDMTHLIDAAGLGPLTRC